MSYRQLFYMALIAFGFCCLMVTPILTEAGWLPLLRAAAFLWCAVALLFAVACAWVLMRGGGPLRIGKDYEMKNFWRDIWRKP